MKVLFEDNEVIVIVKPVGVPSETTQSGEKGILDLLKNEFGLTDLFLLHRLDRNVGGVMVFSKNKKSAACISKQIQENTFKKTYLAVADGVIEEKQGVYKDLLFKDSSKNRSYVVNRVRKGVKEASLEYMVLNNIENKTLVKVTLHTGRTHQIRVQFSSRKTPLCGDIKYGSKDRQSEIALFSHSITFSHPITNEVLTFTEFPDKLNYPWSLFGSDLSE
ncbi:MAG: RluA family pseudouridine synthase [Clostridia bacterium]|nr:RluA family pseudouridine synthase [Clostridia bacterium]